MDQGAQHCDSRQANSRHHEMSLLPYQVQSKPSNINKVDETIREENDSTTIYLCKQQSTLFPVCFNDVSPEIHFLSVFPFYRNWVRMQSSKEMKFRFRSAYHWHYLLYIKSETQKKMLSMEVKRKQEKKLQRCLVVGVCTFRVGEQT